MSHAFEELLEKECLQLSKDGGSAQNKSTPDMSAQEKSAKRPYFLTFRPLTCLRAECVQDAGLPG